MSKQTINIGASPNDGTGTPLRTSFDYCNLNFTELYTAVGPSGNNIVCPGTLTVSAGTLALPSLTTAGDTNTGIYFPAADTIAFVEGGAEAMRINSTGNLVVNNAATITGDLTVDTSTLKVDSTNNRVGIGTASPNNTLTVRGTQDAGIEVNSADSNSSRIITAYDPANTRFYINSTSSGSGTVLPLDFLIGNSAQYRIAASGVFSWFDGAGGTRMTLNSTGLGIGASPNAKLQVSNGASVDSGLFTGLIIGGSGAGSARTASFIKDTTTPYNLIVSVQDFIGGTTGSFIVRNGSTDQFRIDSSGNVGIGVTPSAWGGFGNLQLATSGSTVVSGYDQSLGVNFFSHSSGAYKYTVNGKSVKQGMFDGKFVWSVSGTVDGVAGNVISYNQAMTLDASGNLLVGTTDTGSNSGIGIKSVYSSTAPYVATVGSSTSASQYSYLLYSTGGTPAYKFYVSYSGQISATSGTVAALSDARFKENVQDIDVGLGAILALKPRKFDWKAGKGKDIKGDRGFIAQEFEQVFPNLIEEWADPAPEGEAPYKSVRADLIPVLVKAIQELTARVQTLEAR